MAQYIDKNTVVAEIEKTINKPYPKHDQQCNWEDGYCSGLYKAWNIIENTLEAKEVDLMIHTIIAECCDWLAMTTNLSHDEIEGCRNLMLTVKEEQCKAQQGN